MTTPATDAAADAATLERLLGQLGVRDARMHLHHRYYEGSHRLATLGLSLPPELSTLETVVNWPRAYVDAVEERLDVEGFRIAGAAGTDERLWDWWQASNLDAESSLLHTDMLVYGRAYVTVSGGESADDPPVITAQSPRSMAIEFDPATRTPVAAVRVYDVDPYDMQARGAVLYLPGRTVWYGSDDGGWFVADVEEFAPAIVPVIPFINRARLGDRHGCTEMADVMGLTDAACRALTNLQGAQELLALPQRYVLGASKSDFVDQAGKPLPVWEAYMGRLWALGNADAKVGQLTAADLRNFADTITLYARLVGSVTGLPPHYLGLSTDNPASADAIRSAEARLIKRCERKQRAAGEAWEAVMRTALLLTGSADTAPRLETVWRDPATPTIAAKADAVVKLYSAGLLPQEAAWEQLGYGPEYRARLRDLAGADPAARLLATMTAGAADTAGQTGAAPEPAAPSAAAGERSM